MKNRVELGRRITEIRTQQGISIESLAELCGITASNVLRIEQGKYSANLDIIFKITEALKCRIDFVTL